MAHLRNPIGFQYLQLRLAHISLYTCRMLRTFLLHSNSLLPTT